MWPNIPSLARWIPILNLVACAPFGILPAATPDADSAVDMLPPEPPAPPFSIESITQAHRFVPGKMFGGWGPHLGHLVRADGASGSGADLYWVDDLCSQNLSGNCDVNVNHTYGVFRRESSSWRQVASISLPGTVQQNTATLASGALLRTYGIDIAGARIIECTFDTLRLTFGCAGLPFALGTSVNYIGAALSPGGAQVVNWTQVVDGGGGYFSYVVNYGTGWNGPRLGDVGGYNNCSYVNAAFRTDSAAFTLFGEALTGRAPNWTFGTLVGEASLATTNAVTWHNALIPVGADAVVSTNDLWIDPMTQDTHLIARTTSGAATYYFRPRGGVWSGVIFQQPASFRARLIATTDALTLVYGPNSGGLRVRWVARSAITPGWPVDFAAAAEIKVPLPESFGVVQGIYPTSKVYQTAPVQDLELAVVGSARENEAVFVGSSPWPPRAR